MFTYPHTIENKYGEKLCFVRVIEGSDGDKVEVENWVQPGCGPVMHVHWKQDESLTVISGKLATQLKGKEPVYHHPGDTVLFKRGEWHRFWNAGEGVLNCRGWIQPANNIVYFLSELYKAMDAGKEDRPEPLASAFLMIRYRSEFDVDGIPFFVKKAIIPLQYFIGKVTGRHRYFKNAPAPLI